LSTGLLGAITILVWAAFPRLAMTYAVSIAAIAGVLSFVPAYLFLYWFF
jgi:hypothetical protein